MTDNQECLPLISSQLNSTLYSDLFVEYLNQAGCLKTSEGSLRHFATANGVLHNESILRPDHRIHVYSQNVLPINMLENDVGSTLNFMLQEIAQINTRCRMYG